MAGAKTALVTGASGFIGRHLVGRLIAAGYRVVAVTRRPEYSVAGVTMRVADLTCGGAATGSLADDVDVVFHCAGQLDDVNRMHAVHVGGTSRLIEAVVGRRSRDRPLHWVQLSSVGAYGPAPAPGQPRRVDESTPEHPVGVYESTKTEADRLLVQAAEQGGFSFSLLRPANVVGVGMRSAAIRRLASAVSRRRFFFIGPAGAITNYVHVDDVATALIACAAHPAAVGETFNVSSDCELEQIVERIAHAHRVPVPRLRLPEGAVRVLAGGLATICAHPLTSPRIDALVSRTRYPAGKIESQLGYRFSHPMPRGIDELFEVATR